MMDHQFSLYEPVVRVPLIARYADRFPIGVEEKLVQMHDIYPTVLELAGLEWRRRPGQTCQSLLQPLSVARCGISEYLVPMPSALESVTLFFRQVDCARFFRAIRAIQRENMKLIHSSRGELELYNLADDPMETRNLAAQKPEVTRDLMGALNAWRTSFDSYVAQSSLRTVEKTVLSPESLQEMRGLGYLH
jgi:hypothetical protein